MRLISQNGEIDIPYEQCVIQRFKEKIYFLNKNLTGVEQLVCDIEMASYSSEEKAQKAMEMLRTAYVGLPILFQNVDMNESVVDKSNEWKRDGIVLLHDNADSKIEQVNNAIFQFPKDEDVEV